MGCNMSDQLVQFLSSDLYAVLLLLLSVLAVIHRAFVVYRHRFTIRSRYENAIILIGLSTVVGFYSLINFASLPIEVFAATSRVIWTWMMVGDLYVGHREVVRRNKARALVEIASSLDGVVVTVVKEDCPEPAKTIMQLIELEGEDGQ